MGVLDQIMQMRNQGRADSEIIRNLQERGVPPKEIQDALNQAQIKMAVSASPEEGMQQSIMEQPLEDMQTEDTEYVDEGYTAPQAPSQYPNQQQTNYEQGTNTYGQYPNQQASYGQDSYGDYSGNEYPEGSNYLPSAGTSDTNTLIEIAEQVFAEKAKKIQKSLDSLNEFKTLTDSEIKNFEERLKRIESTIDQLQISIIEKIGSYGKNIEGIKKEMSMMQESFSKVINPILDKKSKRG